jgi:hypothetical protein
MGDKEMNNDDVKKLLNLEKIDDYKTWIDYRRANEKFLIWLGILTGALLLFGCCLGQTLQLTISTPIIVKAVTMNYNNKTILVNQTFADGMADVSTTTMETVLIPMFFATLAAVAAMIAANGIQLNLDDMNTIERILVERKRCKK